MPANTIRVENWAGKDRELKFDINALADLEKALGFPITKLAADPTIIGIRGIRLLVWAGLKHKDRKMDPVKAGTLIQGWLNDGRKIEELFDFFTEGLKACGLMDDDEGEGDGAGDDNPQT